MAIFVFFGIALAFECDAQTSGDPRIVRSLNTAGKFLPDDKPGSSGADVLDDRWEKVTLPHTWNTNDISDDTPGYRRGASWYRRDLQLGADLTGKRIFLYFEAANQVAEVFVNGQLVGKHIGGYSAFAYEITEYITLTKQNFVAVRVDNRWNKDIAPLSGDFNMYGGIYRDVWLIAVDETHFTVDDYASPGVTITTPELTEASGTVRITGTVTNRGRSDRKIEVISTVKDANGRQIAQTGTSINAEKGSETIFDHTTPAVAKPRLWSPDDPYLHSRLCAHRWRADIERYQSSKCGPQIVWFSAPQDSSFKTKNLLTCAIVAGCSIGKTRRRRTTREVWVIEAFLTQNDACGHGS